jgi:hypothetical protein
MENYYIISRKIGEDTKTQFIACLKEDDAFRQALNAFMQVNKSEIPNYRTFQLALIDEDENGWKAVLYQLEFISRGQRVYYFPSPVFEESFFGSEYPRCVDAIEMLRLFSDWIDYWEDTSFRGYIDEMSVATDEQIEQFGVYNS